MVDVDYAYRIHTYLFGLIKVQKILNRDDAIKAKWITTAAAGESDIEMKGADGGSYEEDSSSVVQNPLTATSSTHRSTITFDMDAIYGVSKEEDSNYTIDGGSVSVDSLVVENPIYASTTNCQSGNSKVSGALRLQQSAINSSSTDATTDDEQSLYEEYQSLQSQHDDAVYDINETISFEEWKLKKKQFKQGTHLLTYLPLLLTDSLTYSLIGTRGSFIKAFELFEEREQLFSASDSSKQSASVMNTMHLQATFKVKNVLASKSSGPAVGKANNNK